MGRLRFTVAVASIAVLLATQPAKTQGVLGGLALGAFFDLLTQNIQTAIEQAEGAARAVVIQAGAEAYTAINQARAAYADMLRETEETLNRTILQTAGQLNALADRVATVTDAQRQQFAQDAQQIVNTLPLSDKVPQVKRYTPSFTVALGIDDVRIEVEGNFRDARPDPAPQLVVNGTAYRASRTTQKLTFLVPRSQFRPVPFSTDGPATRGPVSETTVRRISDAQRATALDLQMRLAALGRSISPLRDLGNVISGMSVFTETPGNGGRFLLGARGSGNDTVVATANSPGEQARFDNYREIVAGRLVRVWYLKASLTVPYRQNRWFRPDVDKVAHFDLLIGVLPEEPGAIVLVKRTPRNGSTTLKVSTAVVQQHSSNDDHKNVDHCGPDYPAGYRVKAETVRFVVDWKQGDENDQWSKRQLSVNPKVCYQVTTIHHRFGTSGKVNFHFEYEVEVPTSHIEEEKEFILLKWGESRTREAPPTRWTVQYHSFDGQGQEFAAVPVQQHPYLKLFQEGNSVRLQAESVTNLRQLAR